MTRYKWLALAAFLVGGHFTVSAQDIYDAAHTRTFADYLFDKGEYAEAALEYERLVFLSPADPRARVRLLQAYRHAGRPAEGIRSFHRIYASIDSASPQARRELFRLYVMADRYEEARQLLPHLSGPTEGLEAGLFILSGQADSVGPILSQCNETLCEKLGYHVDIWQRTRRRSPFVAGALSALLPGAGKLYVKRPLDAAFAFIFVAGNAWQSWLGFKREGVKSVRGWIFGGLAAGFYLGNVWGSVRAAKRYNQQIDERLHRQARHLLVASPR